MAGFIYDAFADAIAHNTKNWESITTIKAALLLSGGPTPDQNDTVTELQSYTLAPGADITAVGGTFTASSNTTLHRIYFETSNASVTFTTVTDSNSTCPGVVIIQDADNDSTTAFDADDVPIAYIEFASGVEPNGGDIYVTWSSSPDCMFYLQQ